MVRIFTWEKNSQFDSPPRTNCALFKVCFHIELVKHILDEHSNVQPPKERKTDNFTWHQFELYSFMQIACAMDDHSTKT